MGELPREAVTGRPSVAGTLDRYVVRIFAGPFIYSLAALASLAVVVDVFERLDWLIPNAGELDITLWRLILDVAAFYGARLGLLLFDVGPAIPLLAAMVAAAGMLRRRELVAAKAAGVSAQRVFLPVVILVAVLGLGVELARELAGPRMARCVATGKTVFLGRDRRPVALVSIQGTTPLGDGLVMSVNEMTMDSRSARGVVATCWEEGRSEPTYFWANAADWDGSAWRFDGDGAVAFRYSDDPQAVAVSRVGRLETNLSPRLIEIDRFGIEGLSVVDLIAGRHRTEMASELHRRSAAPLGWVALILLGLPLMMRCGDASPLMGFALSLLMTGVYAAAVSIGWSLALSGQVPAAAGAWVPQAAALSAGIAAYWRMRT